VVDLRLWVRHLVEDGGEELEDPGADLLGLVVVFAFLIPISTTVRAVVLERESKLREQLLTMGATHTSYWGSVLATYGSQYLVTAFICGLLVIPFCFPNSSPGLIFIHFILFALASLAFTLALTPFFRNARIGALAGPGIFFVSSQLYNLFLDRGVLAEDMIGEKWAVSILPAMAFYLGASLTVQHERVEVGVTWSDALTIDGGYSLGHSIIMLFIDPSTILVSIAFHRCLPQHRAIR